MPHKIHIQFTFNCSKLVWTNILNKKYKNSRKSSWHGELRELVQYFDRSSSNTFSDMFIRSFKMILTPFEPRNWGTSFTYNTYTINLIVTPISPKNYMTIRWYEEPSLKKGVLKVSKRKTKKLRSFLEQVLCYSLYILTFLVVSVFYF